MESDKFVETISSISINNGVVRITLVGQEGEIQIDETVQPKPVFKGRIVMPLAGFLYAAGLIQGFLKNERFQDQVHKLQEIGQLPKPGGEQAPEVPEAIVTKTARHAKNHR